MPFENKQMQENMPPAENKKEMNESKGASIEPVKGKNLMDMVKGAGEGKQESETGNKK
jgi:hypothetical protein